MWKAIEEYSFKETRRTGCTMKFTLKIVKLGSNYMNEVVIM